MINLIKHIKYRCWNSFHLHIVVAGTEQIQAPAANRQHNIRINQQFTLMCEIPQTVPEIPIIWLKNGRPFIPQDPNRVLVTQRRISFSPVQVSDTGRYTCMAVDNSASFTAAVNVMAAGARSKISFNVFYLTFENMIE